MPQTIFFSWQSDTPNSSGRNFIESALKGAISDLAHELSVEPAARNLKLDKDTIGTPGSPPIVETIFRKIDAASVYVADLTFIGVRRGGRPTPNPNVLIEYGWALRSRGHERVILVMNTAHGEPSDSTLPFNLKGVRHPTCYQLPEDADDDTRSEVKTRLRADLKLALRTISDAGGFDEPKAVVLAEPPFQPRKSIGSPARFRALDEPIGLIERGPWDTSILETKLAPGPAFWIRVMPAAALNRSWTIQDIREQIGQTGKILTPLGPWTGCAYVRASDGFGYVPTDQQPATVVTSVSFVFKTGEVWTTLVNPWVNESRLPSVEEMYADWFARCAAFLGNGLKIGGPFRWEAGLEGAKGKPMPRYAPPGHSYHTPFTGPCADDTISDSGTFRASDIPQLALVPFFEKLYDACGAARGDHMNAALMRQNS